MSFDLIPADLLFKIFDHLPFKDRVRLRGVNLLFNEISWRSINKLRSLEINDDLEAYLIWTQTLTSLLESCSSTLESIKAIDSSCSKPMLSALTEFVYPKLDHLAITVTSDVLAKKLIRQNRNLRSIYFRLSREFEWPEDVDFEKLEKLEIHSDRGSGKSQINLSQILRPLIGKVPNLKRLVIEREPKTARFMISVQDLNQLLAATPCLKILDLRLSPHDQYIGKKYNCTSGPFVNMYQDIVAALPTWHLSELIYLGIDLECPIPSSILQHFSTAFPSLKSFVVGNMKEIDDQALVSLSKLKHLREVNLPDLEMTKDCFSKMIILLPSITVLQVKGIALESRPALSQLQHLRAFYVHGMVMCQDEIIELITDLPTLAILGIWSIPDVCYPNGFIDFVTTTAALFHRNLEIQPRAMRVSETEAKLHQMKAALKEIEKNGGPVVEMDEGDVPRFVTILDDNRYLELGFDLIE